MSFFKTSLQLYRDCLRLIRHIAPGYSPKSIALRTTVRTQFIKHRNEKDENKVESYKADAIRALSNYMLYDSALKDDSLGKNMKKFHDKNMKEMQDGEIVEKAVDNNAGTDADKKHS